jgi:HD-like signal output (HDOD) protein
MKNRHNIEQILSRVHNLPALSSVADEALKILNDKNSSKNNIVQIIAKEQSFISKILTIANSPIYGLRREVSTLSFAVFILGLKEIKKVVFALAFMESFKMVADKYFSPQKFWLHSFVVGNLSRKIAMDLDIINSGEAFIAGFLHDFPVSLLHRDFKDEFEDICNLAATGVSFEYAEKEILGINHQDIAKLVLDRWEFPQILIDAVANHHTPSLSERDKTLASVIHLADYIVEKLEIANCKWDKPFTLDESILEILHFPNKESLSEFAETYRLYINDQIDSIWNLL